MGLDFADQFHRSVLGALLQIGVKRRQFFAVGQREVPDLCIGALFDPQVAACHRRVVVDHRHVVGGDPDVELGAVDAQFLGVGQGSDRILGRILHAVLMLAAVRDDPGHRDGGIVADGEFDRAERVLAAVADERHEIPARSGGNPRGEGHCQRLKGIVAGGFGECGVGRERCGHVGRRGELHLVAGCETVAVDRIGVACADLAPGQVGEVRECEFHGRLAGERRILVEQGDLVPGQRVVEDAGQNHFAVPCVAHRAYGRVAAQREPPCAVLGVDQFARSVGRALELAVHVDIGFLGGFVPDAHDVVVAARFGRHVALRPAPRAFARGAHIGQECDAGRMASLALLADQETRAAGFMRREGLVLLRAVVAVRTQDDLQRVAVVQTLLERLVRVVVHSVIGILAGTLPRGVRVVGHDALVDVVVIAGQRRAGVGEHLVLERRYVLGRAVGVEDNVEQVGFRRFGRHRSGFLRDGELLDQRGVRDRDEPDHAGALPAHGVFRNQNRQRHAVDGGVGEPVGLALVYRIGPFAVGRYGEHDRAPFVGDGPVFGGEVGRYRERDVFPFGRLVVFARRAERQGESREQKKR